ncbi:MAG: DUF3311 domain-containing protein [Gaiellaceae bacterium]
MPDPGAPPSVFDELEQLEASTPRQRRRWALLLLIVPAAVALYAPFYNHRHPELGGVPFFAWYQIAVVVFGGAVTGVVYLLRGTEKSLER